MRQPAPVHLHSLRKFFFTQLLHPLGRELTEALMGHEEYLDAAYGRYTIDQLAKFYADGMRYVTVASGQQELSPDEVELVASLKALQMQLPHAKQVLVEAEIKMKQPLSLAKQVELLQGKLDEHRQHGLEQRFIEAVRNDVLVEFALRGVEWIDDGVLCNKAKRYGLEQRYREVLDTGVLRYHADEGKWENVLLKTIRGSNPDPKKIVSEKQLGQHLKAGWEVQLVLPSGKILLKR